MGPYRIHSLVDIDQGIYYRLAFDKRATSKRPTPAPVLPRLLARDVGLGRIDALTFRSDGSAAGEIWAGCRSDLNRRQFR